MSSCCSASPPEPSPPEDSSSSCCGDSSTSFDWLLWGSLILVFLGYFGHLFFAAAVADMSANLAHYCGGVFDLFNKMWWGLGLGILAVGSLGWVPREWVASVLGKPGTINGLIRAIFAGLFLDLCNHGILLVAMKLYERGASYGQTLAFLIASPWNSLSLTLVLIALIGIKWTLGFILLSVVVAIVTGLLVEMMVKAGRLPANKNSVELPDDFKLWPEMKAAFYRSKINHVLLGRMVKAGLSESQMIVRWIFFGTVLAAAVRAFVPVEVFGDWFGPTWIGVLLTLVAATVIEVCSEGSSPIAADLVTRANAPGNGFAFLMAGAATDYTEIMALKETTRSWKMAFVLPMCTLPQVVVIAWLVNSLA
ncbi:MAG: permease [Akkermansiaceae bacterium]|nr:permease [Akkermansiaceae bacterium]